MRRAAGLVAWVAVLGLVPVSSSPSAEPTIIHLADGSAAADLDAGRVTEALEGLGVVLVEATAADLRVLAADPDVTAVSPDVTLVPASRPEPTGPAHGAGDVVGAPSAWAAGLTGAGTVVAVVDTGVSDHPDLAGRVVRGPDLSDGRHPDRDEYGHGTVLAGVVAGDGTSSDGRFTGVAPEATILSVKVAGADGTTTAGRVLRAIDWVVATRDRSGADVLLLAWATDAEQSARVDPLAHAVTRAADAGLVVVVAAGNAGPDAGSIGSPGTAPAVVTVGAADPTTGSVTDWSGRGPTVDGLDGIDLVAPGAAIVAPVDHRSTVAIGARSALFGRQHIRGSGTSQAAAVAAGVAALLRGAFPHEPGQVTQARLTTSVRPVGAPATTAGAGLLDAAVLATGTAPAVPTAPFATDGTGDLELAGGTQGSRWSGSRWSGSRWSGSRWSGSRWSGSRWSGSRWSTTGWSGDFGEEG
ncbi:MAG: S8 family serine peptidase [Actinomycetes bacterium]